MRRLIRMFRLALILILVAFFSYALPQQDVARVTDTSVIRQDFSAFNRMFYAQADSGNVEGTTRDVRLIETQRKRSFLWGFIRTDREQTMVYRNEDTGWIWPPYFKFDSSDLQAEAGDFVSTSAAPRWVIVRHYGWRIPFLTIYPNATAMWEVSGPDVRVIPWFNIGFFIFLAIVFGFARLIWRQFRERSVDPVIDRASDTIEGIGAAATTQRGRLSRWLDTWRRKRP
jgi:hypothetical protein